MDTLLQDLRYGLRTLSKRPGFTLLIVLTLALGIGANTAIFSVVSGVLLQPLPYRDGHELVVLQQHRPQAGIRNQNFSIHEIYDYQALNRTFEGVVEHHTMFFNLLGHGEPERVQTGVVSHDFFDVLGIPPLHGRIFIDEDDDLEAEAVLLLTYEYWQQSFNGDPDVVGQTFEMNDRAHTVVGVLPPFPQYPTTVQVYMPTNACPFRANGERANVRTAFRGMTAFGRLQDGVDRRAADADLARIAASFRSDYPDIYPDSTGYEAVSADLHEELTRAARPTLLILLGTAGFVLLIVCANVANLTLVRLLSRDRELALRNALGASAGRILRQQLTESTLLAVAGGALGLLLASASLQLLKEFAARFTPRAHEIALDPQVLLFTLVVSLGTGLLFGSLPALSRRADLTAALKDGSERAGSSSSHRRLRSFLVVAQLAVSFVLLIGAGLMLKSLTRLQAVDPGFQPERVLSMQIALDWSRYTTPQQSAEFWGELLRNLNEHPQVRSAAQGTNFPLGGGLPTRPLWIESQPAADPQTLPVVDTRGVSHRYFDTLGMKILSGRGFDARDHVDAPSVAVINETAARTFWPDRNPLGDRVSSDGQAWSEVIGVVSDVKQRGLTGDTVPEVYVALEQGGLFGNRLLAATLADPESMVGVIREEVYRVDPNQPVSFVQTMEQVRASQLASPRLTTALLSVFAALALLVTLVGISGLIAFSVNQRTQEIGIRMALGSRSSQVLSMLLRQGLMLIGLGLLLGAIGSIYLSGLISGLLFEVEPGDPLTFVAVAALFLAVGAAACLLPARRATAIDPMIALRND